MLPLNDPRWQKYNGGYRQPYDASIPIKRLFSKGESEELWKEFWHELHHQGDVDAASYAAVPYLVDYERYSSKLNWNAFALIGVIELERPSNPDVPTELADAYYKSLQDIPLLVAQHSDREWDQLLTQSVSCCIALARGQREFARIYLEMNLESGLEWLKEQTGYEPDGKESPIRIEVDKSKFPLKKLVEK